MACQCPMSKLRPEKPCRNVHEIPWSKPWACVHRSQPDVKEKNKTRMHGNKTKSERKKMLGKKEKKKINKTRKKARTEYTKTAGFVSQFAVFLAFLCYCCRMSLVVRFLSFSCITWNLHSSRIFLDFYCDFHLSLICFIFSPCFHIHFALCVHFLFAVVCSIVSIFFAVGFAFFLCIVCFAFSTFSFFYYFARVRILAT